MPASADQGSLLSDWHCVSLQRAVNFKGHEKPGRESHREPESSAEVRSAGSGQLLDARVTADHTSNVVLDPCQ